MSLTRRIRAVLANAFQRVVVPIRQGPLKGSLWTVVSGTRFIKGTYEQDEVALFEACLRPGDVVYDVGAHMGYYTLVAAQSVDPDGHVYAFEPLPFNLTRLHRHVRLSRRTNISIIDVCVGATSGMARFTTHRGSGTNHLDADGNLVVTVVALDSLVKAGTLPLPQCIKVDVEGSELEVLQGAQTVIAQARPFLFISFHGQELEDQCSALLHSWGYRQQGDMWQPEHPSFVIELI